MPLTVMLRFSPDQAPAPYRIAADEAALEEQDFCLVTDDQGRRRVGYVIGFESRCARQARHLGRIERRATEEEIQRWQDEQERRLETLCVARARAAERGLPMKFISVHFDPANNVVLFNFTSDRRIDFRELVRDLAAHFRARIELWQIGVRQGAAEKDGFGLCGQRVCCANWIHDRYPAVSMRHVRDQDMAGQTPQKLAGLCGRLRCCLRYEHEWYREQLPEAPATGATVRKLEGGCEGIVQDRNLIRRRALVRFDKSRPEWIGFDKIEPLEPLQPAQVSAEEDEDEVLNN